MKYTLFCILFLSACATGNQYPDEFKHSVNIYANDLTKPYTVSVERECTGLKFQRIEIITKFKHRHVYHRYCEIK